MKISTKIFISTVLVMTISFSIAGFILLSAFFKSGYEQAVRAAVDSNWLILNSFTSYMRSQTTADTEITDELIKECLETVTDMIIKDGICLRVYVENGQCLYSNIDLPEQNTVRNQLDSTQIAYFSVEQEGRQYIETISSMSTETRRVYMETFQDVTYLYRTRQRQLSIYRWVMLLLFFIYSLISYWLARFLVHPIRSISRTASRIADGNLEYRIRLKSQDEFGEMVYNFNRMADNLAGKIEELEDAARRQEEFVGNFTHELKTPLTSIIGYADLMRSDESISEMNLMCANYIFQEGKRLESLSFRLLDLIVLKKQEVDLKNVSVIPMLKSIHATVLPILTKEHIRIIMKAQKGRIMAEPELMKTVIMNLIDNARKAVSEKGEITLRGTKEEKFYEITVQDNGKGIPREQIDKITEAFYMVDKSRSREQGGAGLGLAICAQIVQLHGGSMKFESEEGKGTKVILRLKTAENLT